MLLCANTELFNFVKLSYLSDNLSSHVLRAYILRFFSHIIVVSSHHSDARYWYGNAVRPSVRPSQSGIVSKLLHIVSNLYYTSLSNSLNEGVKCRWGTKKTRFSRNISAELVQNRPILLLWIVNRKTYATYARSNSITCDDLELPLRTHFGSLPVYAYYTATKVWPNFVSGNFTGSSTTGDEDFWLPMLIQFDLE